MALFDLASKLTSFKNAVLQVPPIEAKTREITSNVPWGSQRAEMMQIAEATEHYDEFKLVMKVIWERIRDRENVRHVQKGLQLFEFLVANGSMRVIEEAKDFLSDISDLKHYKLRDENGKDIGGSVRDLAAKFESIVSNDKEIDRIREESRRAKSKYQGISRDDSKYSSSSYSSSKRYSNEKKRRDSDEKDRDSDDEKKRDSDDFKSKSKKRYSFDKKEEEEEEEEKPKVVTKPVETKKVVEKPVEEKKKESLFDDFFTSPSTKIDPFAPTTTVKTPNTDDFFKSNNSGFDNGFGNGGFGNDGFDAKFDADFTDFQSGNPIEEKKPEGKNDLIDFTKDLVNLSLNEKKPVVKEEKKEEGKKTVLKNTPVMGRDAPWEKPNLNSNLGMKSTGMNTGNFGGSTGMVKMGGNTGGFNNGFGTTGGFNTMGGMSTGGFNTMGGMSTNGFNNMNNGFGNTGGFNNNGFNNGFNNNGFNNTGFNNNNNKRF